MDGHPQLTWASFEPTIDFTLISVPDWSRKSPWLVSLNGLQPAELIQGLEMMEASQGKQYHC